MDLESEKSIDGAQKTLVGTFPPVDCAADLAGVEMCPQHLAGLRIFGIPQNHARRRVTGDRVAAGQDGLGREQVKAACCLLKACSAFTQGTARHLGQAALQPPKLIPPPGKQSHWPE